MAIESKAIHVEDTRLTTLFGRVFAALGHVFNSYLDARGHAAEIAALEAKSDKELAELGISRDQIVRFAFREDFYC